MSNKTSKKIFTISEASRILKISADTLRRLESKGKFKTPRDKKGNRNYSDEQIKLLKLIVKKPLSEKKLYNLEETSKILKISKSTLRRWDKQGKVTSIRTAGGHRRYDITKIGQVMESGKPWQISNLNSANLLRKTQEEKALKEMSLSLAAQPKLLKFVFFSFICLLVFGIVIYFISKTLNLPLSEKSNTTLVSHIVSKYIKPEEKIAGIDSLKEKILKGQIDSQDSKVLAATSFSQVDFIVTVKSTFEEDVDFEKDINVNANANIGGILNLEGNSIISSADILIIPGGGGVSIGGGTPSIIDLENNDLFVTDELEVGGNVFGTDANLTGDLSVDGDANIGTLTLNTETYSDLTGTGLINSGGALSTTFGTSVESSEITDDTIKEVDLNISNSATNAYVLTYNSSSGGFTWAVDQTGTPSKWSDSGTTTYLTDTADELVLGGTSPLSSSKFSVDGDSDQIQFTLQGASSQTSNIFVVENSSGSDFFTISADGNVDMANGLDINSGSLNVGGNAAINNAGAISATQVTVDNLQIDGNTFGSSSGDIIVSANANLIFSGFDCTGYSNGGALTADASGNILCSADDGGAGGVSPWTDTGGVVSLIDGTKNVTVGSSTNLGKLAVDGDNDEIQLLVQSFGTQTQDLVVFEQSDGTDVFRLDNSGNLAIAGTNIGTTSDTDLIGLSSNLLTINGTLNATSAIQTNGTQRLDATGNLTNIGTTQLNSVTYTWPGADGGAGYSLTTNGTGTLSWTDMGGSGANAGAWTITDPFLYPDLSTYHVAIGTTTTSEMDGKFTVSGQRAGKALVVFDDESTDQNILTASSSSTTVMSLDKNGNLTLEGVLSDLSQDTLAINDSLSVNGSTGLTLSGVEADMTFSSTGNHDITASSGTLRLGAATLLGTIAANNQNVTGVGVLDLGTGNVRITTTNIGLTTDTDLLSLAADILTVNGTLNAATALQTAGSTRITNAGNLTNIGTTQFNTQTYTWPGDDGNAGEVLQSNGTGTLDWVDITTGGSAGPWTLTGSALYPDSNSYNVGIGSVNSAEIVSKLFVDNDAAATGKALAIFNQTENQDIIAASASSGTTRFRLTNDGGIQVAAGQGLDTLTTGTLNLGSVNSTSAVIGSSNLNSFTVNTNSTGDAEVVLPEQSISTSEILNNTIDFTDISNSLSLDATTTIAYGNNNFEFNLNGSGDFVIQNGGTPYATFRDDGIFILDSLQLDGTNIGLTTDTDLLLLAANTLTINGTLNATSTIQTGGTNRISSGGNLENIGTTQFNTQTYTWPIAGQSAGFALTTNGTGTLSWTNIDTGNAGPWTYADPFIYTDNATDLVGIGTITTSEMHGLFSVRGNRAGKALTVFDERGTDQNIITASAAGTTVFNLTRTGNLQIAASAGLDTLSAGTLNLGTTTANAISLGSSGITTTIDSNLTLASGRTLTVNGEAFTELTGNGLELSANTLAIRLDTTAADGSAVSSVSGLELAGGELSLIRGCGEGQVLKWDSASFEWECAADAGAGGATSKWTEQNSLLYPNNATTVNVALGTLTESQMHGLFTVSGTRTGRALTILNDTGNDQNILTASASGTTVMNLDRNGNLELKVQGDLRLYDSDNSNYTGFQAPALTSNLLMTLPGDVGGAGYVMQTNGSGTLSWVDINSGGSAGPWTLSGTSLFPDADSYNVGVGTSTPGDVISKLFVDNDAAATGKALAIFNQTENQDILTASVSADTRFRLTNAGNLLVAASQGLDTLSGGVLNLGTTNATSAVIGSAQLGSLTVTTNSTGDSVVVLPEQSVSGTEILNNTLDFVDFEDTLDLDASTTINNSLANGNNLAVNLALGGDFVVSDAGSPFATFTDTGEFILDSLNLDGSAIGRTTDTDLITLADNLVTINGTLNATTAIQTGGTQRIDASGNLTNIGTTQFNTITYTWPSGGQGAGYALTTNGTGTLSWTDIDTGGNAGPWTLTNPYVYPDLATYNIAIGTLTTSEMDGKFTVTGQRPGKALVVFDDESTDQNILTASASGTTVANLDRNGNLAIQGQVSDLIDTTLTINDSVSVLGDTLSTNQSTFNLINSTATTVNFAGAATVLNIADAITNATIDIGGVTADGTTTVNIATNGAANADTVNIGNSNAASLVAITGGNDWSITNTGVSTFTQVLVDSLTLDGTSLSSTGALSLNSGGSSDLTLDSASGNLILGVGTNSISNSDGSTNITINPTAALKISDDNTDPRLILSVKSNTGDPTGADGAMYYNSDSGKFRCYEGGSWNNCITAPGTDTAGWTDDGSTVRLTTATDFVAVGANTADGKFGVTGQRVGQALAVFNTTSTDQNILTASASGTTVMNLDRNGNFAIEGAISDLSDSTLAVNDSLSVSGTAGISLSGVDADITLSGTGNHDISASGGTLRLGAFTLLGAITGNDQNITGVGTFESDTVQTNSIQRLDSLGNLTSIGTTQFNGSTYTWPGDDGDAGDVLQSNGAGTLDWVDITTGGSAGPWTLTATSLYPDSNTYNVGIGTVVSADITSKLFVDNDASATGKALAIFNQTESQDILSASVSGSPRLTVTYAGNLQFHQASSITTTTGDLTINSGANFIVSDPTDINNTLTISDDITFDASSPNIAITNGETLTITDGTTTLLSLVDDGTTGNMTITGDININENTTLGNANSDTLTINAGTSGTGINFGDASFQNCSALETNSSGVLVCGSDAGTGSSYWELSSNTLSPGDNALDTDRLVLGGSDTTLHQFEVNGAQTGKSLVALTETGDQNIITASSSATNTVFNLTRSGKLEAADLTLGLNDSDATITTYDTNEALTIDTNGTGALSIGTTLAAKTITIGNSDTATLLSITGGDDWNISSTGVGTFTQVNADNLRMDGNTFSSTAGDITIDATDGNILSADSLNIGGAAAQSYNYFAASVAGISIVDGISDLYIEDEFEVDGNVSLGNANSDTLTINSGQSGSGISFTDSSFANCSAIETVGGVLTCGSDAGTGANYWQLLSNTLSPGGDALDSDKLVLGSADTTVHQFEVNGSQVGKALAVFDEDGNQNILVASVSGIFRFAVQNDGDLELSNSEVISNLTDDYVDFSGLGGSDNTDLRIDLDGTYPVLSSQTDTSIGIGENLDVTGTVSDSDSNLILDDTVEIGSSANGLRVDTDGIIIDIDDDTVTITDDLAVNGATSADITSTTGTATIFDSTVTTLSLGGAATTLNLGDGAITGTIDIGGVTANGSTTVNIATNNTSADTITVGNNNTSTLVALTGGDDWNITVGGDATFDGSIILGDASGDTLTINAGSSGTGIAFGDSSFSNCTALETVSGVLTCGTDAGTGNNYWQLSANSISPGGDALDSDRLVLGGANTTAHQFEINGAQNGKALVSLTETGDQNILTASSSASTTVFNLTRTGNVQADGVFSFGDASPDAADYNEIGTGNASHTAGGEITDANDLFVSDDLEVDGQLFIDTSLVIGGDTITDFVGDGLTLSSNVLTLRLDTTAADGSTTTSVSGLETVSGELSLLRGCGPGQILKWDDSNFDWDCAADEGAGAGSSKWTESNNLLYPNNATSVSVALGTSTESQMHGLFTISGTRAGRANTIINDTGTDQNILVASSSGNFRFAIQNDGDLELRNAETISNSVNGQVDFSDGTKTLTFDIDATNPMLISSTTALSLDDDLQFIGDQTISTTTGNLIIDPAANLDIDTGTIDLATQNTNIDLGASATALTFESSLLRLDTSATSVEVTGTTNLGDGGTSNYAQFNTSGDLSFNGLADTITGPGAGGLLTITNTSGNVSVTTATAGDVTIGPPASLGTGDDLIFQDGTLASTVPLTIADTALNSNLSQAIIDAINDVFDEATGQGANGLWKISGNVINPNSSSHSVAFGGTTLAGANFAWDSNTDTLTLRQTSANNTLVIEDESSDSTPFTIDQNGNVGIGTASPVSKLHVTSTVAGKALATFNDQGTDQNILTASASGITALTLSRNGDLTLYSTTSTADKIAIVPKNTAGTSYIGTLTSADLDNNYTWEFPSEAGTICLTSGNCAGVGGVGDIESVGDILSGHAFTQTTGNDGNQLYFEGTTANSNEILLTAADPGSDLTVTLPAITGTLASLAGTQTFTGVKTFDTDLNLTFAGTENLDITSDLAGTLNIINIAGTPSTTAGTVYGIYIDQINSSNSNGFDAFALLDNSDTNLTVADGILFTSAGGLITDAIDASASQIDNALNVGGNIITGTAYSLTSSSGDITIDSFDELVLADSDTIIIGGHAGNVDYNVISDSGGTPSSGQVNSDNDLYIQGTLEAGTIFQGANPVCDSSGANCPGGGSGGSKWTLAGGTIYPFVSSLDVLIGGTATSSAKIGFINMATGTPTIDVSNQATDVEIGDTLATAITVSEGSNNYLSISTDASEEVTLDLPVAGGTSTIGNLFTSNVAKTINLGTGTANDIINIGDAAGTNTIDIGGVTNSGTDTINIGTNATAADTITIGNSLAATTLALTGGDDWSITSGGAATFDANVILGDANLDTLIINAGTSGAGISFGDPTFANCTALETASGVLTCGTDAGASDSGWNDDGTTVRLVEPTDFVAIGANTADGKLGVTGQRAGQALVIFNNTSTDQNILSASQSGVTRMNLTRDGQLEIKTDGSTAGLTIGAGEDLSLYHDGTDSYLANITGNFIVDATNDIYLDADGADILFRDNTTTFATFTNSTTDLTINVAGGQFILADGDFINIGGLTGQTTNSISDAGASINFATTDNDLYIQDILEVDGTIYQAGFAVCDSSGANCPGGGSGGSKWTLAGGTIYPFVSSLDVLIGGTATSSAKIGFINMATGTPTIDVSNQATDVEIGDTLATAITVSEGSNNYLSISTDASEEVTLDLPVAGGTSTIGNLFTSNVAKTINLGTGTANDIINIGDAAGTNTIDIGGVTNSGTDTINIGTNATAADTITIGNSLAATTLALTGGDDWSITAAGNATFNGNTILGNAATDQLTITSEILGGTPLVFEGATNNNTYTSFAITDPTVARTITFPDDTGTVCLSTGNCTGSGLWSVTSNAFHPREAYASVVDVLIGGSATASADFAFKNVASGIPTLTISGDVDLSRSSANVLSLGSDDDLLVPGGDITGAGGAAIDIGEATSGDITFTGDLIVAEDAFIGRSSTTPRLVFDTTPTPDEIDVQSATLDLNNNLILNIGDANTDFTSGGGLTLAGNLISNANTTIGNAATDQLTVTSEILGASPLVFEGATDNNTYTTFTFTDPTGARTITFPDDTGTVCLSTGNCSGTAGASKWTLADGTIYPFSTTLDVLIGGTATASADFAFKNIGAGIPTLTISGDVDLSRSSANVLSLGSDDDLLVPGGDITGAGGAAIDIGEATSGDITFTGDLIVSEDAFLGLSSTTARFVFDSTPTPDEIDVQSATLDLNNNLITNVGSASTDFTSGGGLTLAGNLVSNANTTIGNAATDQLTITSEILGGTPLVFEGATDNNTYTSFVITDPTGARTITFPDDTGTVCLSTGNCTGSGLWAISSNAFYPRDAYASVVDVLIGGNSTASADFAFTNIAAGTPTFKAGSAAIDFTSFDVASSGQLTIAPTGALTTAIDVTDADITNAISLGTHTILASGSFSIDLVNAANDTLTITNTGAGIASLSLEGDIAVNGSDITSSGDLTLNPSGGDVYISNSDTLIIGGHVGGTTYNVISDAGGTPSSGQLGSDNDLYIQGTLEAGLIYQGANQVCDNSGNCSGSGLWQNTLNAFHPRDAYSGVADILIGGTSTASADFAFKNIASGTPTLAAGSAAIDFTNFDVATTGNITVATGTGLDTNGAGVLALGNTNATTVSVCNSTACDTLSLGTNADADAINIGDNSDTLTLLGTIDASGATSFELPNSAAPTVNAFGEIAGDDNYYAAGRGALLTYDGTLSTFLIGILTSDTCSNGQVPKFNTGGTWTCEDDSLGVGGSGTNYWQLDGTSKILSPGNTTWDLNIGGTATASASFMAYGIETAAGGVADIVSDVTTTGDVFGITSSTLTGGSLLDLSTSGNTWNTGNLLDITSTSTGLTSGRILNLDWNPSSGSATGDLFRLNIGSGGNVTNLINITDNGSTLFRVSETQIESAVPHAFTAAGDLTVAYDVVFSNESASTIKSNAPLAIEAGDIFESNNLTLTTYNSGDIVLNLPASGYLISTELYNNTVGVTNRDLFIDNTGIVGYVSSSNRYKENVESSNTVDWLYNLRPVTFTYTFDETGTPQYGLIAEEVDQVNSLLVSYDETGIPETVSYTKLITPLLTAVQNQKKDIDVLKNQMNLVIGGQGYLLVNDEQNEGYSKLVNNAGNVVDKLSGLVGFIAENIKVGYGEVNSLISESIKTKKIAPLEGEKDIEIQIGSQSSVTGNQYPVSGFGKLLIKDRYGNVAASIDEAGNAEFEGKLTSDNLEVRSDATIAGELRVGKVIADEIVSPTTPTSLTRDEIEALIRDVSVDADLIAQTDGWGSSFASGSASFNELALENLFVTGTAAVDSLSVNQSIVIGSNLVISSLTSDNLNLTSIDSIDIPLSIQSSASQPLYLMAGLVSIDTQGNVQIAGDLAVKGNIESSSLTLKSSDTGYRIPDTESGFGKLLSLVDSQGNEVALISATGAAELASLKTNEVIATSLNITNDPNATITPTFDGLILQTTATAGNTKIPTGLRSITIRNPNIKVDSLVFITPTSEYTGNLYIISQSDGEIKVGFSESTLTDVNFNWWLVGVIKQASAE